MASSFEAGGSVARLGSAREAEPLRFFSVAIPRRVYGPVRFCSVVPMLWWRRDGDLVRDATPLRRVMPLIMRGRNESAVFFEQRVDITKAKAFLDDVRARSGQKATLLHLLMFAITRVLHERPRLNRFAAGGRLWQRRGIWLSFSAKREKSDASPLITVKREIDPRWSFEELVERVQGDIRDGRGGSTQTETELKLAFVLPTFVLSFAIRLLRWLDHLGLLPAFFLRSDPLYASAFLANLGSLGMEAAHHHLYEYGTIPIFCVAGAAKPEVVVGEEGVPAVRELITLRYTFDERVEDGLYCLTSLERMRELLEDPARLMTPP